MDDYGWLWMIMVAPSMCWTFSKYDNLLLGAEETYEESMLE